MSLFRRPPTPDIYDLLRQVDSKLDLQDRKINLLSQSLKRLEEKVNRLINDVEPPIGSASKLVFQYERKDNTMVQLSPGQTVSFSVAPVAADGSPSKAKLSNLVFSVSDPLVFTLVQDSVDPTSGVITALTPPISPDAAVITASATATEADGTTNNIVGSDTVTVVVGGGTTQPAAALIFSFGSPK